MPSSDDFDRQSCLRRVREDRDEDAARALLEWMHPLVARIAHSHRPRRTEVEDLCQTVLMNVFTHLDQYEGRVPLAHWVSRVAVNTCLKALRAEKSRPEWRWADLSEGERLALETAEQPDKNPDAAAQLGSRELVDRMLAALAPQDRLVIQLLHLEERSISEICTLTGWSTAGVKVRAFRARQRMRKILKQLEKEEVPCPKPMIGCLAC